MSAARSGIACAIVGLAFLGAGALFEVERVYTIWVAATVVVELLALAFALRVREDFEPGDAGRTSWTLIVSFLAVRILAELRLLSFYFDFVPGFIEGSPGRLHIYTVWLRYLYTLADVLMVGALLVTLRSYAALGLQFELRRRDWPVIVGVASLPLIVLLLRDFLGRDPLVVDAEASLTIYRIIAATVGSAIAAMSLAVLRFVRQMGGGLLARVWGAIGVAGLARAFSFVLLATLGLVAPRFADLGDQAMLWVFASAWLTGVLWQYQLSAGFTADAADASIGQ